MAFWEVLFDITKNLMYSYLNVRWVLFENFISRLDWNFSYACSVDRLRLAGLSQGGNGVWCASLWSPLSFPRCQRFEINTNEPCPCKCCDKTPITNLRTAPHELSTLSWFRFRRFRGGELFWHQIAQSIFCDSRCGNWAAAAAGCSMCGCESGRVCLCSALQSLLLVFSAAPTQFAAHSGMVQWKYCPECKGIT